MKQIVGKVRFDAQTKITNAYFREDILDYSGNIEYQEMIKSKNFYEATLDEFNLCVTNEANGIQMCVINGILQVYVIPDDIKLAKAKTNKLSELQRIYSSGETWILTLKDGNSKLTKEQLWLLQRISTNPKFKDDNGNLIDKIFTVDKVFEIINQLNNKGLEILTLFDALTLQINSATSISDIKNIDISSELAKIEKIIDIS
jgi:hypothetical protein